MACARGTIFRTDPLRPGFTQFVRPGCKKLTCPTCGPIRAEQYRKAIVRIAEEKHLTRFVTLTLDPKKLPTGTETVSYIRETWSKFRKSLERTYARTVQFVAVLEFQKNGRAHLHVLIDRYIEQSWLKEHWEAVGGGRMVWITIVDPGRIDRYLTKYLTKEMLQQCPPRRRRITTSRGLHLQEEKIKQGWAWKRTSFYIYQEWCSSFLVEARLDEQGMKAFSAEIDLARDGPWDGDVWPKR